MLGGLVTQYEYNRKIWIIKCNSQQTKTINNSNTFIVDVEQLKIQGPEPKPRVLQTAIFYKTFIVIFGGRNYEEESYCLNDLLLLDIKECKWQPIVVYGFIPSKRWGHVMGVHNDSILIIGGVSESSLASSTVYTLELNPKTVKDNIDECKRMKIILEIEAKKIDLLI